MLGHALHQTNRFGFPLEYVNPANLAEWKKRLEITDFNDVLTEIQRRRTSPNGVFGIKIHYPHVKQFGGFQDLVKVFPNAYFVLLSRNNVLKQAVSLSIASQTGVWISGQKSINDNPEYNFTHIEKCLRETILNNSSWRYTLAASGCNYIEINFDHVRHNIAQCIENIASFLDIEIDVSEISEEQVTRRQSNNINNEWAKRFVSDFDKADELLSKIVPSLQGRIIRKVKRMINV
jgi:LPS sulfotransferase NodH